MRNNNKILTIAVVFLLLANIALVTFMLLGKNKRGGKKAERRPPHEMMIKELGMTEEQKKQYTSMREDHFKSLKPVFDSVNAARTAFFAKVKEEQALNDSTLSAYREKINPLMKEVDRLTFEHFRSVRKLLTAEQQPKYDSMMQKMMQRGRRDSADKRR